MKYSFHKTHILLDINIVFSNRENISKILITKCDDVIAENMEQYFTVIQNRIENEKEADDSVIIVKALDKFCRKLQTANVLTPHSNFIS